MERKTISAIRRALVLWYEKAARDLPWRRTRDPYAILVSEIMLQQTRVAAVIPYYARFMERFPTPVALAAAPQEELLAMWAGLGYYSRARNLQAAARKIAGTFPSDHVALLELPGVGSYTAAAVASIAFGLPHAAVDGNVRRVVARLSNDGVSDAAVFAGQLLDRKNPGRWNQAMMELGATICVPRDPLCDACPVAKYCSARAAGTQHQLPVKKHKPEAEHLEKMLLVIRDGKRLLLIPSERVTGFWDLPETFPGVRVGAKLGEFRHTITHRHYRFLVHEARARKVPQDARWFDENELTAIPLATTVKKALRSH